MRALHPRHHGNTTHARRLRRANEYSWDSDAYPKGPYWSGDSYSDTPDHCGTCGLFLENPLTPDGYRYIVWESINAEWDAFYGIEREA